VRLAEEREGLFAAVGIHPHDAKTVDESSIRRLKELARSERVVALGEIGLDFFRDLSPRPTQRMVFERLIGIARDFGLPIIVHDRNAHDECLETLRQEQAQEVGAVFHCFSGDAAFAQRVVQAGFYLGLDGPITYPPRASDSGPPPSHQVARSVPLDRLLIETDCPWLPPQRWRGKRNEPAYLIAVAEKIGELRGLSFEEVAQVTTENGLRLFGRVR
jgi:TatD DNase family protein